MDVLPDHFVPPPSEHGRRYTVSHRTAYSYGSEMLDGYSVAHLLARQTPFQYVASSVLTTDPDVDERDERVDVFGNHVVQLGVHRPHDHLLVDVSTDVIVEPATVPETGASWELVAAQTAAIRGDMALEISPYLASSRFVPIRKIANEASQRDALVAAFGEQFTTGRPIEDVIGGVCNFIFEHYRFDPASTTVSTPLGDVLAQRAGVCQDFAHLAVGAFRARGIASRYVSGYIETDPPPGEPKTIGADASHAWCAVWIPEYGWVDLDPTNGIVGPDRHVTIGWGRDYADVAPIRGVVIGPGSMQTLSVEVDVVRR
ncbi:MAG: transglutaminase family protein [Ilumatobacter sp.]|nr:transglutaminase family protein [Ilumatobacter sp.]